MRRRHMPKAWRCSLCFKSFNTAKQAEAHWREQHDGTAPQAQEQPPLSHENSQDRDLSGSKPSEISERLRSIASSMHEGRALYEEDAQAVSRAAQLIGENALEASGHADLVDALERIQDEANTVCGDWRETASLIDSICFVALAKHGGGKAQGASHDAEAENNTSGENASGGAA